MTDTVRLMLTRLDGAAAAYAADAMPMSEELARDAAETIRALQADKAMLTGQLQASRAMLAASPQGEGPAGWLVKDFADGWYWTGDRLNADMAANGGACVFNVDTGTYETGSRPQGEGSSGGPMPSKREVRLVLAARSVAFGGHFSPNAIKELDAASEAYAADVPWDDEPADGCVCVQRGDGPEGCGLCNETGVVTSPASPQGEDGWIKHDGGPNPVPGQRVDTRHLDGSEWANWLSDQWGVSWLCEDPEDGENIIAYRPAEGVKP